MKIKTHNLGKKFNRDWIFRNLTYEFVNGTPYALLGPNGSGKSTLIQILWGQMPSSAGTIEYSNANGVIPVSDIFKSLAIAAPYMDLIDEFTLEEMVNFHFKFKTTRNGFSTQDIIGKMELGHAREKTISKFSSGMKQRVKLGLAFSSQAEIIFLDEPGTNLDKKSFGWYLENLNAIQSETLVFIASNHEQEYPSNSLKINILDYK
jgi:ABC-type multidrug transport system, ATPase component